MENLNIFSSILEEAFYFLKKNSTFADPKTREKIMPDRLIGRTADFGSVSLGSSPSRATITQRFSAKKSIPALAGIHYL
jgi:hypothetical protein